MKGTEDKMKQKRHGWQKSRVQRVDGGWCEDNTQM
jgi:hypothetical protein